MFIDKTTMQKHSNAAEVCSEVLGNITSLTLQHNFRDKKVAVGHWLYNVNKVWKGKVNMAKYDKWAVAL